CASNDYDVYYFDYW
nr:immunoglobulin heavy chain junction region [Mus musculus]